MSIFFAFKRPCVILQQIVEYYQALFCLKIFKFFLGGIYSHMIGILKNRIFFCIFAFFFIAFISSGAAFEAEAAPALSGTRWYFASSIASPLYMPLTGHINNHAYRIDYELNGGTADNPASYTPYSDTFTLNAPKKEGYTFIGWLEEGDKYYIAHRGSSFRLPENTKISVQEAIDLGYSHIEIDVRFTSDGVPVILHDDSISRTGRTKNGSEPDALSIKDITYDEAVSGYDFGLYKYEYSIEAPSFGAVEILTLDDFLSMCSLNNITPVVELKTAGTDIYGRENLLKVAEALKAYNLQDKAIIASWNPQWLREMHDKHLYGAGASYCVSITQSALGSRFENVDTLDDFTDYLINNGFEFIEYVGPEWRLLTDDDFLPGSAIQMIKDKGFGVSAWTINSTVARKITDSDGFTTERRYDGEYLASKLDVDSVYTDALLPRYSMQKTIRKGSVGNKSFRAMYKKNERSYLYSVSFDGNGATEGSMKTIVDFHEVNGMEHTVILNENTFLRDGYVFSGWNTRKDGSGTAYEDKAVFAVPDEDTVLFAQWEKI